jgi:hypothetical protein
MTFTPSEVGSAPHERDCRSESRFGKRLFRDWRFVLFLRPSRKMSHDC